MDSGNSGSLQSSSGGDEEYDSRAADSVSAFMSGGGPIPNPPPFFDPLSNYLQLHQNPNSSLLNSSISWPRTSAPVLRSDPNQMSQELVHSMLPASTTFMPCFQPGGGGSSPTVAPPLNQNQNQNQAAAARNPKKRSRASRRAPTTVLTTDTTNFRAMVQEFTGIPAPPFNSSSFPRTRLDLFGSRSTSFDAAPQPPPYLRRPFAQKVQPPHPFLSSSTASLAPSTTNNNSNMTPTTAAAASMNYQLPMTQSSNLFNIPNQNILTSLLQSNPKFPFSTSPIITSNSKPQNSFEIPSNDDQFQVSGTLTGLPNLIPSDHNDSADTSNVARWSSDGDKDGRLHLNGNYEFQRNTMNGKMSFSASSTSGFHGGKAPENVSAAAAAVRGEGMVESWLCSSE
ncbi:hypothetical protein C2S52_009392 [Perilla frutescens var. hirtella]|nr:hypothetical protein C2S51_017115 [Perilla frutescens var. frutescens]KAH6784433.1 hypothetical protein C2S52_009392 [Perilla frutescens var. hirtella]